MRDFQPEKKREAAKEERRSHLRRALYIGEGFSVRLFKPPPDSLSLLLTGEAIDLSAEGLSIAATSLPAELELNSQVAIALDVKNYQQLEMPGRVVSIDKRKLGGQVRYRIGIVYVDKQVASRLKDRRKANRYICPPEFQPIAFCHEALFFREFLCFQVVEISPKGARLRGRLERVNLVPGLCLHLKVQFPNAMRAEIQAKVTSIKASKEAKEFFVGIEWQDISQGFKKALGSYLFYALDVPVKEVHEMGLKVREAHRKLFVTYPSTDEEWNDMLRLRLHAYQGVGKFVEIGNPEKMLDSFDSHSRVIICKAGSKIVGTARIIFNDGDKNKSEHERIGISIPERLWESGFVEISRLCTHPDYRGSDVLPCLLQHLAKIVFQSGHRFLVSNCNDDVWRFYKTFGWRKLGTRFEAFGRNDCNLLVMDLDNVLRGKDSSFLAISVISSPIIRFLVNRGLLGGLILKIRLKLHQILSGHVADLLDWVRIRRKRMRSK